MSGTISVGPAKRAAESLRLLTVVRFGGRYHLFYTGYPGSHGDVTSYRIGHAVSDDGIAWTRTGVVLAPSAPDAPPNPDFRQFVEGRRHLFFAGHTGLDLAIGVALDPVEAP